jgi:hypothetical protein
MESRRLKNMDFQGLPLQRDPWAAQFFVKLTTGIIAD